MTTHEGGEAEGPSRPLGVFVLDDHPAVAAAVAAVVESTPGLALAGSASDGATALSALAGPASGAVLLADVNLAGESGVEVARSYVREQGGRAVLMSARAEVDLPADWRASGVASFLPKDLISSATLLEHVVAAAS